MNEALIEKVAGYIKHREPHFSREDAKAAALHAVNVVIDAAAAECYSTMCSAGEHAGAAEAKKRVLALKSRNRPTNE